MCGEQQKHEYEECAKNMRHYSNLRFAILTVYGVAMAGLITLFGDLGFGQAGLVGFLGILISLVFMVMHERVVQLWVISHGRACELEESLMYEHYRRRPPSTFFSNRNATRVLFGAFIVLWILILIFPAIFGNGQS